MHSSVRPHYDESLMPLTSKRNEKKKKITAELNLVTAEFLPDYLDHALLCFINHDLSFQKTSL